ncbi:MAG: GNAT family N-acetyltransferase [Anaerolineae bacterium]|nr:GNAT family N-acetyltransferase [Anaerolineae bacterium]
MPDLCELAEWDSHFFSIRIARATADRVVGDDMVRIMQWCSTNRIDCLYFLSTADDASTVRQLEDNHFRFVDVRLTFERTPLGLPSAEQEPFSGSVRQCVPGDIPYLKAIAKAAYRDTRFYFDPNFSLALCDALYETWIEKSCLGYADAVLVYETDEKRPAGYVTCHSLDSDHGQIGLVGVALEAQGRGVGRHLVSHAVRWFADQGIRRVSVVTQARNWRAQRLYQHCGFLTTSVKLWYHRWFMP